MRHCLLLLILAAACSSKPAGNEPAPVEPAPAEPEPAEPEPVEPEPVEPEPSEPGTACQSDDDCVMTTFAGCCDCCGCTPAPRAIHRRDLESKKRLCQRVRCNMSRCAGVDCAPCPDEPPPEAAVCRDQRCVPR